jgi:adenylate cyclase
MDYTVIGDGVNLASRLESACKAYSAHILASESTIAKLRGTYRYRDIDLVVVKGKTRPVRVYEILDHHDAESFPNMVDVIARFNDSMNAYRSGDWSRARDGFRQCLRLNPADRLSETYIGRCDHLESHPPEGEWDGVWVMKDK